MKKSDFIEEYKTMVASEMKEKKKSAMSIKRKMYQIDEFWNLIPTEHHSIVEDIAARYQSEGSNNPRC